MIASQKRRMGLLLISYLLESLKGILNIFYMFLCYKIIKNPSIELHLGNSLIINSMQKAICSFSHKIVKGQLFFYTKISFTFIMYSDENMLVI